MVNEHMQFNLIATRGLGNSTVGLKDLYIFFFMSKAPSPLMSPMNFFHPKIIYTLALAPPFYFFFLQNFRSQKIRITNQLSG